MDTERPAGPDARYLTVTAQAFGWDLAWGEEGLAMRCGAWAVRAQFTPEGAFVVAVADGPDGSLGQMSMPQALEILETAAPRCPASESAGNRQAVVALAARPDRPRAASRGAASNVGKAAVQRVRAPAVTGVGHTFDNGCPGARPGRARRASARLPRVRTRVAEPGPALPLPAVAPPDAASGARHRLPWGRSTGAACAPGEV
ncbi:hypothetical protein ACFXI0_29245 [Kitasatospora indigofera]|uniref:hypothetical protein n=1 Tax=Kitasatospora indigofera TaxID=67307 RepID=UPI0036A12C1B